MAIVYWVCLPNHSDMFKEGYIGISNKSLVDRKRNHISHAKDQNRSKYAFQNAILKYGEQLIWKVILESDFEYCKDMERKLRPEPQIGWNISVGGNVPGYGRVVTDEERKKQSERNSGEGNPFFGKKHSEESKRKQSEVKQGKDMGEAFKKKMSEIVRGKPRNLSEDQRKVLSERRKTFEYTDEIRKAISDGLKAVIPTKWESRRANKDVWAKSLSLYDYYVRNPTHGSRLMASNVGLTFTQVGSILREFRNGWNPCEDDKYLSWLHAYELDGKENNGT